MKFPHRRQLLHLAAGAAALPALSLTANAQAYPSRVIKIVVGFPAGGGADIVARLIGQWLSERLGQQVVIENRPGAGGNIATEAVVRAPADGYTLLFCGTTSAVNATLYEKLNFNFIRDTTPVGSIAETPNVLVVHPSVPIKDVPELIAFAKGNPGKINMASAGNGTSQHLFGELFKLMTGVDMVHVPYRGGAPALTDLLAGQVQVMFDFVITSREHIRSGKLRALAVTTGKPVEALPGVPSIGAYVAGYDASGWNGLAAPKGTPPEIIARLNKEINAALANPKIKTRLGELGNTALGGSPTDFGKLIADETEKWGKVVRAANIKAE